MMRPLSRRAFLGQAAASPVAGVGGVALERAWIIVAVNWEYNDEYSLSGRRTGAAQGVFSTDRKPRLSARRCARVLCAARRRWTLRWTFSTYRDRLPDDATEETARPGTNFGKPAFLIRSSCRRWKHEQSTGPCRAFGQEVGRNG